MILHSAGGGGWANDITLTGGGGGGNILTSEWEAQRRRGGEGGIRLLSEGGAQRHGGGELPAPHIRFCGPTIIRERPDNFPPHHRLYQRLR